ncbi:unnamed protein product [Polarella glacialis]|nr:unnamed protein product [Polarella glacialis]
MEAALEHMPLNDDTKPLIITAMNERYKTALTVYAKHFCGKSDVVSTQIISLEETRLLLRYWDATSQWAESTVTYQNAQGDPVTADSAAGVRRILLNMARTASEATGLELGLPQGDIFFIDGQSSDKVPGAYLLNDLVDMSTLECLNQDDGHPVSGAISKSVATAGLRSDPEVDHQLLIKLGFRQPVKLKAISFHGSTRDATAPKVVKIFQGQVDIGFQEAEDQEAVQLLDLSTSQVEGGDPVPLRFVKFQSVSTLQLFVQENFGAEVTCILQLQFWGTVAETVDMKAWKPTVDSRANPVFAIREPVLEDHSGI